jgi:CO/xanthine dehydrogenase FAD-binding subunit
VPPLLALGAQIELVSKARGIRILPLEEFMQGVRRTDLASDELVAAIIAPSGAEGTRSAFEKLGSRRYLVISISMVAAVISCDFEGRITDAKIAVGSCSPVAMRLTGLERDLINKTLSEVCVSDHHLAPLSPISDVRGSESYRIDVVAAQIMRAIRRAIA